MIGSGWAGGIQVRAFTLVYTLAKRYLVFLFDHAPVIAYTWSSMHVVIKHSFKKEDAISRIKKALTEARAQAAGQIEGVEEHWEGDTLTFALDLQGKKITGTLDVRDQEFELNAKLPLMWRLFEGKLEKMIAQQAGQFIK